MTTIGGSHHHAAVDHGRIESTEESVMADLLATHLPAAPVFRPIDASTAAEMGSTSDAAR